MEMELWMDPNLAFLAVRLQYVAYFYNSTCESVWRINIFSSVFFFFTFRWFICKKLYRGDELRTLDIHVKIDFGNE